MDEWRAGLVRRLTRWTWFRRAKGYAILLLWGLLFHSEVAQGIWIALCVAVGIILVVITVVERKRLRRLRDCGLEEFGERYRKLAAGNVKDPGSARFMGFFSEVVVALSLVGFAVLAFTTTDVAPRLWRMLVLLLLVLGSIAFDSFVLLPRQLRDFRRVPPTVLLFLLLLIPGAALAEEARVGIFRLEPPPGFRDLTSAEKSELQRLEVSAVRGSRPADPDALDGVEITVLGGSRSTRNESDMITVTRYRCPGPIDQAEMLANAWTRCRWAAGQGRNAVHQSTVAGCPAILAWSEFGAGTVLIYYRVFPPDDDRVYYGISIVSSTADLNEAVVDRFIQSIRADTSPSEEETPAGWEPDLATKITGGLLALFLLYWLGRLGRMAVGWAARVATPEKAVMITLKSGEAVDRGGLKTTLYAVSVMRVISDTDNLSDPSEPEPPSSGEQEVIDGGESRAAMLLCLNSYRAWRAGKVDGYHNVEVSAKLAETTFESFASGWEEWSREGIPHLARQMGMLLTADVPDGDEFLIESADHVVLTSRRLAVYDFTGEEPEMRLLPLNEIEEYETF